MSTCCRRRWLSPAVLRTECSSIVGWRRRLRWVEETLGPLVPAKHPPSCDTLTPRHSGSERGEWGGKGVFRSRRMAKKVDNGARARAHRGSTACVGPFGARFVFLFFLFRERAHGKRRIKLAVQRERARPRFVGPCFLSALHKLGDGGCRHCGYI